jgi:hypothetical protein
MLLQPRMRKSKQAILHAFIPERCSFSIHYSNVFRGSSLQYKTLIEKLSDEWHVTV